MTEQEEADDQYKRATKAVVDDAMRLDVLGPKAVEIFEQYAPAKKSVKDICDTAIKTDKDTQDAIKAVVDIRLDERKIKGMSKLGWIGIVAVCTIVGSIISGFVVYNLTEDKSQPQGNAANSSSKQ